MINRFENILQAARLKGPKTIAVAAAQDEEVLLAVHKAHELGLAEAILIGHEDQIRQIAAANQLSLRHFTVIDQPDHRAACQKAVELVASGTAQLVMKGLVDTAVFLQAVLAKESGLKTEKVLSHVAVAGIDGFDRPFYITDAAMNIAPDLQTKKQMIENAVQVARALGHEQPKVACICAIEKTNARMQATIEAAALAQMNASGELSGCTVDGPLALDNAISVEAARHKGIDGPVAGQADILLMPDIEAGNILYKSIVFFARGNMAGIVVGAKIPVILTSRADSEIAKLNSIALGVLLASR